MLSLPLSFLSSIQPALPMLMLMWLEYCILDYLRLRFDDLMFLSTYWHIINAVDLLTYVLTIILASVIIVWSINNNNRYAREKRRFDWSRFGNQFQAVTQFITMPIPHLDPFDSVHGSQHFNSLKNITGIHVKFWTAEYLQDCLNLNL